MVHLSFMLENKFKHPKIYNAKWTLSKCFFIMHFLFCFLKPFLITLPEIKFKYLVWYPLGYKVYSMWILVSYQLFAPKCHKTENFNFFQRTEWNSKWIPQLSWTQYKQIWKMILQYVFSVWFWECTVPKKEGMVTQPNVLLSETCSQNWICSFLQKNQMILV